MDASEWTPAFHNFIDTHLEEKLSNVVTERLYNETGISIDFQELAKSNPELAEDLLDYPEEVLEAFEYALSKIAKSLTEQEVIITPLIENIPRSNQKKIKNITSHEVGKIITATIDFGGKSARYNLPTFIKYECPSCGLPINIPQDTINVHLKTKVPSKCTCGRQKGFRVLSTESQTFISASITDIGDPDDEDQSRVNKVLQIRGALTSPEYSHIFQEGTKVRIVAIPRALRNEVRNLQEIVLECVSAVPIQEPYTKVKFTKETIKEIHDKVSDPDFIQSSIRLIGPGLYGLDKIKKALFYAVVGGSKVKRVDGSYRRSEIHTLLIGDPGTGKSRLLKSLQKIHPKVEFASGRGASRAGLTFAMVKDIITGRFICQAGAMIRANLGLLLIDELDKIDPEDQQGLNEGMEQQEIAADKAGVSAVFPAKTQVIAGANPKHGKFDKTLALSQQLGMSQPLLTRFGLIIPFKDEENAEKDERMLQSMFEQTQQSADPEYEKRRQETEKEIQELKEIILYMKSLNPIQTQESHIVISNTYIQLRTENPDSISPRYAEDMQRLSEAISKTKLQSKVSKASAEEAVELFIDNFKKATSLPGEEPKLDLSIIYRGESNIQHTLKKDVLGIINTLSRHNKLIPIENIVEHAKTQGISEHEVNQALELLQRNGDIYEPKRAHIMKLDQE